MSEKLKVPKLETEAEEAQWWFDNSGPCRRGVWCCGYERHVATQYAGDRLARAKASQVPIVLDSAGATVALELAAKRGETYADFVRPVVHRALELEKTA